MNSRGPEEKHTGSVVMNALTLTGLWSSALNEDCRDVLVLIEQGSR